jgi:hypothetical protein
MRGKVAVGIRHVWCAPSLSGTRDRVQTGVDPCKTSTSRSRLSAMNLWIAVALCGMVVLAVSCSSTFTPSTLRVEPSEQRSKVIARFRSKKEPAVLFVGNSYSIPVPRVFRRQCRAHGQNVRVGQSTIGGWSLAQHAAHEPTLRKIREGGWDIVVLQELSRMPALPRRREQEMLPPMKQLADEARAAGAIPVIYQTWARRDGDLDSPIQFPDDDFHAMHRRLKDGIRLAAHECGDLLVVPVGEAWARETREGRGKLLYVEDGSHPSSRGIALTARVFVETFLGPGKSS